MANITAEIPTVEEVIDSASHTSDMSTIVSEALERRSSNSSVAAFSPFIVADVKNVNDIPEVTMTQSVYASLHAADIPAPPVTPLPTEDVPVIDTDVPLPESTESSVDEPAIPINHHPREIAAEPVDNSAESGDTADDVVDDANSEHSEEDNEDSDSEEEENTIHSDEEIEKPQQVNLAAHIPTEIMFLLFTVLILNFFNFLLTLTGARQCIRPF
jgi:hypothetical protein